MKTKKIQTLTILITISLSFIGCNKMESDHSETTTDSTTESTTESTSVTTTESSEEHYIPVSEVSVPSYLMGEETNSFSIVEEHEDSITYQLGENQQEELLDQVGEEINESIRQVLTDKQYYPNIVDISVNKDYSQFDVTFSSPEINIYETTLRMSLYIAGNKFQLYQGNPEDSLLTVVNYINDSSGDVFSTGDSRSLQEESQDETAK